MHQYHIDLVPRFGNPLGRIMYDTVPINVDTHLAIVEIRGIIFCNSTAFQEGFYFQHITGFQRAIAEHGGGVGIFQGVMTALVMNNTLLMQLSQQLANNVFFCLEIRNTVAKML